MKWGTAPVKKALFDAQSIIAAVTDNTPVKLTVAEQTLVGRITGGNIDDLSVAQGQTLLSVLERPSFTYLGLSGPTLAGYAIQNINMTLYFDGGSAEFTVGETITATSGGTGVVHSWEATGAWGSGTATGKLYLTGATEVIADFADNDTLTGSVTGVATQKGALTTSNNALLYTIGSGEDYETYAAAADDLKSLILEANLALQLAADTETSVGAVFDGLFSVGGRLILDLNDHTYELSSGAPSRMFTFQSPVYVDIRDYSGTPTGKVKMSTASTSPAYTMFHVNSPYCVLRLVDTLTMEMTEAYSEFAYLISGQLIWVNPTVTLSGSGAVTQTVKMVFGAIGSALAANPTSLSFASGAIWVDKDGKVYTAAGLVGP